jgi:hypothetical protein
MLDLTRCNIFRSKEIAVATGSTITEEGVPLQSTLQNGEEVCSVCASGGSENFIGFSYGETFTPLIKSNVESAVIPAASPYTITLEKTNIIAAQIFIYDETDAAALAEDTLATGKFSIVDSTGVVTFHSAQAGNTVTITYRYTPTVAEVAAENDSPIYRPSGSDVLGQIGVILAGEVYTDKYDASISWESGVTTINVGTGLITNSNSSPGGVAITCDIIHVPDVANPFLGIRF